MKVCKVFSSSPVNRSLSHCTAPRLIRSAHCHTALHRSACFSPSSCLAVQSSCLSSDCIFSSFCRSRCRSCLRPRSCVSCVRDSRCVLLKLGTCCRMGGFCSDVGHCPRLALSIGLVRLNRDNVCCRDRARNTFLRGRCTRCSRIIPASGRSVLAHGRSCRTNHVSALRAVACPFGSFKFLGIIPHINCENACCSGAGRSHARRCTSTTSAGALSHAIVARKSTRLHDLFSVKARVSFGTCNFCHKRSGFVCHRALRPCVG